MSRKLHRVVVTGIGSVSCYGLGTKFAWESVLAARSGISSIQNELYPKQACRVYGKVPLAASKDEKAEGNFVRFNPEKYASKSQQREMGDVGVFAIAAVGDALQDAKWSPKTPEEKHTSGIVMGTAFSDYQFISECSTECAKHGNYSKLTPFFGPRLILNMPAARASIRYGLQAVQLSPTTACAIGTHSIGDAFRMIRSGACNVIVAGGTEGSLKAMTFAGLSKMRALSTRYNTTPVKSSRPFDADRDGFVMSEGAAAVVLENLDHYLERVKKLRDDERPEIYAEILGYGFSSDAHHVTSPTPNGEGMRRSMQGALRDAELSPNDITHVNCHATATPAGDVAEIRAVCDLFASSNAKKTTSTVYINSTKGATGHMVAAAGSMESIFTAMACKTKQIAPCINLNKVDPAIDELIGKAKTSTGRDIKLVGALDGKPAEWNVESGARRIAIKNSFGFGGTNASICIAAYEK